MAFPCKWCWMGRRNACSFQQICAQSALHSKIEHLSRESDTNNSRHRLEQSSVEKENKPTSQSSSRLPSRASEDDPGALPESRNPRADPWARHKQVPAVRLYTRLCTSLVTEGESSDGKSLLIPDGLNPAAGVLCACVGLTVH